MSGDEPKDETPKIIHSAELEDEMEDRYEDAVLRGLRKARQSQSPKENKAQEQD